MASIIELSDAQAWIDQVGNKLPLASLDDALVSSLAEQLKGRLGQQYNVEAWTNTNNTPALIKKILGMQYIGWHYQRVFANDTDNVSNYGARLLEEAEKLIVALTTGVLTVTDVLPVQLGTPAFYPTNASSALDPTTDDPSLGGPVFALGTIW